MATVEMICTPVIQKQDCDLSTCYGCKETIYSQNNVLGIEVNDKFHPLEIKLCDSCVDLINEIK